MRIVSIDWVSRCEDANYDALIESLAPQGLDGPSFVYELNLAGSQPPFNEAMLVEYISDRQGAGALNSVEVQDFGALPAPTSRYAAPTGLGEDGSGVWFSTPDSGIEWVRWYVNGALAARESRDLSSNRSQTLAAIGAVSGDVVQICIESGGVIGWWERIEIA